MSKNWFVYIIPGFDKLSLTPAVILSLRSAIILLELRLSP